MTDPAVAVLGFIALCLLLSGHLIGRAARALYARLRAEVQYRRGVRQLRQQARHRSIEERMLYFRTLVQGTNHPHGCRVVVRGKEVLDYNPDCPYCTGVYPVPEESESPHV